MMVIASRYAVTRAHKKRLNETGTHGPKGASPAVWGLWIGYCNVSALLVVAMDIRGTLLASVPRVWSSPVCVWTTWAVTRAPKKTSHEMSEKGLKSAQIKVKAPVCGGR